MPTLIEHAKALFTIKLYQLWARGELAMTGQVHSVASRKVFLRKSRAIAYKDQFAHDMMTCRNADDLPPLSAVDEVTIHVLTLSL